MVNHDLWPTENGQADPGSMVENGYVHSPLATMIFAIGPHEHHPSSPPSNSWYWWLTTQVAVSPAGDEEEWHRDHGCCGGAFTSFGSQVESDSNVDGSSTMFRMITPLDLLWGWLNHSPDVRTGTSVDSCIATQKEASKTVGRQCWVVQHMNFGYNSSPAAVLAALQSLANPRVYWWRRNT